MNVAAHMSPDPGGPDGITMSQIYRQSGGWWGKEERLTINRLEHRRWRGYSVDHQISLH